MAEAPDSPADKAVTVSAPNAAPASAVAAPAGYGSVSILAIVGLALAVLYAIALGAASAIALIRHTPLILPIWTLIVPAAAAAVCWAARGRIRSSEGALSGSRLTAWGLGVAAVAGVLYTAYYAGCYFAVTGDATRFTDKWMELLHQRQLDKAFLYTRPPPRPNDDERLRDLLEMNYDRDQSGQGGALTQFRQSQLVHQFENAAGSAQVQLLGVQQWNYDQGAYSVVVRYRVATAQMISEMVITAVGVDDEASGERLWYAKDPVPTQDAIYTDQGKRAQLWEAQAHEFGEAWLGMLATGRWDGAYLATLPPEERLEVAKQRTSILASDAALVGLPAAGLAPLQEASAVESGSIILLLERRRAFAAGDIVHFDPDTFWVGPKESDPTKDAARRENQTKIANQVRAFFAVDRPQVSMLSPARSMPLLRRDGDTARVALDLPIPTRNWVIQARLWLAADLSHGDPSRDLWRIDSIELLSAKSASGAPARPMPPHGMRPQ